MAAKTFDLVVVGSGVLGLSHAAAAAARGLTVAVIDRSPTLQGASVRNFGLLTQLYNDGSIWGARAARSRQLYGQWRVPLSVTGSLQLIQSAAQLQLARAYADADPAAARLISADDAVELCPAVRKDKLHGALYFADDALLEPRIMARRLPADLSATFGVQFHWSDGAAAISSVPAPNGSSASSTSLGRDLRVTTQLGTTFTARKVVLCTGDDVSGLVPMLLLEEAAKLQLCKLQMTRVALAQLGPRSRGNGTRASTSASKVDPRSVVDASRGGLTMPVTSGLSMRRYPALAARCPTEHRAMMDGDDDSADASAEALGIHVIARPAPVLPRGKFGEILHDQLSQSDRIQLNQHEVIIGDSHQYAPLHGLAAGQVDEVIDEGVTNEMLRVAGSMLTGLNELRQSRMGDHGRTAQGASAVPAARLLSQWHGTYMQHSDGVLNATIALHNQNPGPSASSPAASATPINGRQLYTRLNPVEAQSAARSQGGAGSRGLVQVVTGIGGRGMTMSPAIGEENIEMLFPQ